MNLDALGTLLATSATAAAIDCTERAGSGALDGWGVFSGKPAR